MTGVLSHNEGAAAVWRSGGRDDDRISEHVADALAHVVNRLLPQPNERILDVATGWTARHLASRGARVTGVDIGAGIIEVKTSFCPALEARSTLESIFRAETHSRSSCSLKTAAFASTAAARMA